MKLNLEPMIRFVEHMPPKGDTELGLLKGHLLIEEVLTKLIERSTKKPEFLLKARLTFAQKVWLARSLHDLGGNEWVWGALRKLNEARNELSHGLASEKVNSKLKEFMTIVESAHARIRKDSDPRFGRFQWSLFDLFSCISFYAHFDPTGLKIPTVLDNDI